MSKSLLKSTSVVSGMTMISRLLGFARDMVFAFIFGAYGGFDAYVVAFKIPNFMRRLFAEGAFSQAFVPVLSEYQSTKSPEEAKELVNRIAGSLASVLLLVTLIAEIAAPLLIAIFAPGFWHDPHRYHLAVHLLRITFPYLMLISLTAFCSAVLNSYRIFAIPAFAPVLLNVSLISVALWLVPLFEIPEEALAWGVMIGGFAQLLFQLPFMAKKGLLPNPKLVFKDPGVRKVLRLMVPAIFGVSIAQLSLLIDTVFASYLKKGSMSWLYYSQQLTFFPLGVFGVALATVVLPQLSRNHATHSNGEYTATVDWALRCVLVIALPAALGLALMSGPLICTLFQSGGKFDLSDTYFTQQSLLAFSVGLPGFMLVKVLASAFYSRQDIRTPVRIGVIALCTNIVLNFILIYPLQHAGLALATALSSTLNAGLLMWTLTKQNIYQPLSGWPLYLSRLLFASGLMAMVLWFFAPPLAEWSQMRISGRAIQLGLWISVSVVVYLGALWGSGLRLRDFKVQAIGEA